MGRMFAIFPRGNKVRCTKDWVDAFIEANIIQAEQKKRDGGEGVTPVIQITSCNYCSRYSSICAYVSQFKNGGFWLTTKGLTFVTGGSGGPDKDATYEDAKAFLEVWKDTFSLDGEI
jgi:hypothetical protein